MFGSKDSNKQLSLMRYILNEERHVIRIRRQGFDKINDYLKDSYEFFKENYGFVGTEQEFKELFL